MLHEQYTGFRQQTLFRSFYFVIFIVISCVRDSMIHLNENRRISKWYADLPAIYMVVCDLFTIFYYILIFRNLQSRTYHIEKFYNNLQNLHTKYRIWFVIIDKW